MTVGVGTIGLFVLLRAFASGSTALTGVEAIANGVSAFRRPQARNAARTLGILGVLAITFFLGVSYLAIEMHAVPNEGGYPSVVSQIARVVFPSGSPSSFMYYAVQASTVAILVLAANTAYQGFPRLAALLARDRFFPRQFTNLGDRLVFSNGIVVLAAIAAALIWIYAADVEALIHLYVIGVFTAFTLSQTGMVRYWLRTHDPGWRRRALINGVGAVATFVVTLVVIWTKFAAGAWMVIIAIPLLVLAFLGIRRHYRKIARRLRAGTAAVRAAGIPRNQVLIVAGRRRRRDRERALVRAADRARRRPRACTRRAAAPTSRSGRAGSGSPGREPRLELLDPAEGRIDAVLEELWKLPRGERDVVTVVIPEQFRRRSLLTAARRTAFRLKLRLLSEPGVVVADVPAISDKHSPDGRTPTKLVTRILVADVNAASMRALNYAQSLDADDVRAVFFADQPDEARALEDAWRAARISRAARGARGAVPRHRRPAAPLPPRADERPRRRGERRHAGARASRLAPDPSQPARALHQAAAPLRAPRHPHQRSVPALPVARRGLTES